MGQDLIVNLYEPQKVIEEWNLNYNLGSVIKYVARASSNDVLENLLKAREFLDNEILRNQRLDEDKVDMKMVNDVWLLEVYARYDYDKDDDKRIQ